MPTSIAFLRGVNVAGRVLSMEDVRAEFTEARCDRVRTYIQSGNVVFSMPEPANLAFVANVERALEARAGYRVGVVVVSTDELRAIVNAIPFPRAARPHVHVAFLKNDAAKKTRDALYRFSGAPEEFSLGRRVVYLLLPNGVGRAKLPPLVTRLEPDATLRNLRTVVKLLELAST